MITRGSRPADLMQSGGPNSVCCERSFSQAKSEPTNGQSNRRAFPGHLRSAGLHETNPAGYQKESQTSTARGLRHLLSFLFFLPFLFSRQRIAPNQVRKLVLKGLEPLEDVSGALLHFQRPGHALKAWRRLVYHGMLNLPEERREHRYDLE